MTFANPTLLFGLVAIVAPIIIHLLNRRQFRRVKWAAMRFVQVSMEQNQRRIEMEDLILLMLRCGMVALLAFALSRPFVPQFQSILLEGHSRAVLLIDQSASLTAGTGSSNRFRLAQLAAHRYIDQLPTGTALTILSSLDNSPPIIDASSNLDEAHAMIDSLVATHRSTNWPTAISKAIDYLSTSESGRKEIGIITDNSVWSWQPVGRSLDLLKSLDETTLNLIVVGGTTHENIAVSELASQRSHAFVNEAQHYVATITNFGNTKQTDIGVELMVNEQPIGEKRILSSLDAGESRTITFFAQSDSTDFLRITAKTSADQFTVDNSRSIVLPVREPLRVLLVDGEPKLRERDSETFFLQNALVPVTPVLRSSYYIQPTVMPTKQFSASTQLSEFDAVVLSNVATIPEKLGDTLQAFVRKGGGLLIFPGNLVVHSNYHRELGGVDGILPARFAADSTTATLPVARRESTSRRMDYQQTAVSDNPLLRAFHADPQSLAAAEFWRVEPLEAVPSNSQVLLRYDDGSPALVAGTFGQGNVLMFASTADIEWNDLPIQTEFVPLVREAISLAVRGTTPALNVPVGTRFSLPLSSNFADSVAMTFSLKDTTEVGTSSKVQSLNDGSAKLVTPQLPWIGVYESRIESPPNIVQFTTQMNSQESRLSPLTEKQLEHFGEYASITRIRTENELTSFRRPQRTGSDLTRLIVPCLFLLAVVELCLSQKFSDSK